MLNLEEGRMADAKANATKAVVYAAAAPECYSFARLRRRVVAAVPKLTKNNGNAVVATQNARGAGTCRANEVTLNGMSWVSRTACTLASLARASWSARRAGWGAGGLPHASR